MFYVENELYRVLCLCMTSKEFRAMMDGNVNVMAQLTSHARIGFSHDYD